MYIYIYILYILANPCKPQEEVRVFKIFVKRGAQKKGLLRGYRLLSLTNPFQC